MTLEATLAGLDAQLAGAEKHAVALLEAVRHLRKVSKDGVMAALPGALDAAQADSGKLAQALERAGEARAYDVGSAFASGAWLDELAEALRSAGLTLVRRDGRVTVFPVLLRLDARNQAVRIGQVTERRLRPSVVAAQLKLAQQRSGRFNPRLFLDRLHPLYEVKAAVEDLGWRPGSAGQGPLVSLADLHALLTVLPAAASDYPLDEFLADILYLDRQPDATDSKGRRFELSGSTGRKGGKRLTVYDETGEQHDYFAIRFIA
jgi:hypothetical protein